MSTGIAANRVEVLSPSMRGDRRRTGARMPPERLETLAHAIWQLGERALYELLAELLVEPRCDVAARIEAYARLRPAQLFVVGADRIPPRLFAVRGGR